MPLYNLFAGIGIACAAAIYHARLARLPDALRWRAFSVLLVVLPMSGLGAAVFDRLVGAARGPIFPIAGLAFYGGLIGGCIGGIIALRVLKVPIWIALNAAAPAIALGHAIGRIGCAAAGCCFGLRVSTPGIWAHLGFTRVPTQLIEASVLVLISVGLLIIAERIRGSAFLGYLVSYAFARFIIEWWRADPRGVLWSAALSPAQITSIAIVSVSVPLFVILRRKELRRTQPHDQHCGPRAPALGA